jgi:predicted NBD/HSP70 family sugar kinase
MRAAPSQEEVRRQNLGALLRYLHRHGAMSRAELTAKLGLNRSTIGALTADLAAASLVTEEAGRPAAAAGRSGRAGRPSLVVTPRSDAAYAYAASVEADRVRAARVGLGGVLLDRREAPRDAVAGEPASVAAGFVAELHGAAPRDVRCIGAGVAGVDTGVARAALTSVLPEGIPVVAGTVSDLAAVAEHARGAAAGCDNVIYLYGATGVTAGIIMDGRRFSGAGGAAGAVGHMVVNPGGHACACGARGCWETEVGEQALLRAAGRSGAGREAVRAVVDAADRGDARARDAVRQVGGWLGLGVANLVNIFNPDLVIFGEALRDIYLVAAASVRSRLNSIALGPNLSRLRLRTPALGDDAPMIGAAELAFEALLADPLDGRT